MKHIIPTFLLLFLMSNLNAQYQRLKLFVDDEQLIALQASGIAIDHGDYKKGVFFIGEFSSSELALIQSANVEYEVIIDDLEAYYISDRSTEKSLSDYPCEGSGFLPVDPVNYENGSMGGYFTYQEYLNNLDSMAALYPDLISIKQSIDTFLTHEDRPLYWVKISDNPSIDEEDEAEVLYTSLHHAREPASLSQNIYYMWYLLENYATDVNIQGLVNTTEMYFVPMINPDGYIQNQTSNPNGGGMWRKNKRDNDGNLFNAGVDLNRNYSYEWGGLGTSSNFNSEVYRGPNAFSEPETQAIKYFTENHDFKFALNYHTHGNLLLFPFGFDYDQFTEDHDLFISLTDEMVLFNNYNNMISSGLYPAAGDSDDWMYGGDLDNKPKIMAMTPEVGDEFWPPEDAIIGLCQENVYQNLMIARYAGVYAKLIYNGVNSISGNSVSLPFDAIRLGQMDGSISIEFVSESTGMVISGNSTFVFENPSMLETMNIEVMLSIDENIVINGETLYLKAMIDNGSFIEERDYSFSYGNFDSIETEDCETLANFENDGWALTDEDSYSPTHSITDSPYSEYSNNEYSSIQLAQSIDLSNGISLANLTFWAKWEIEASWDYAQVLASTNDGITWIPLCGNYTHSGTSNQDFEQPIYDGFQSEWIQETVDLNDFVGEEILIGFRFESDSYITEDGFYFDDLSINVVSSDPNTVQQITELNWTAYPNPANDQLIISNLDSKDISYILYDRLGREVKRGNVISSMESIDISNLENGLYILHLKDQTSYLGQKKIQVIH